MKKKIFGALFGAVFLIVGSVVFSSEKAEAYEVPKPRYSPNICFGETGNMWAACLTPDPSGPCDRAQYCNSNEF